MMLQSFCRQEHAEFMEDRAAFGEPAILQVRVYSHDLLVKWTQQ